MDSLKASLSASTSSRKKVNRKLNEDHWGSDGSGMKVWVTPKNLDLPRDWLRIKGTKMYSETRSWIQQLQLEYQLEKWGSFSPGQFHVRLNISLCVPNGSHGILTELEEKLTSPRDGNSNC